MYIVAAILFGFGLLPGMPFMVFFTIAGFMILVARQSDGETDTSPEAAATGAAERRTDSNVHLSNMDEAESGETNAQKIENYLPLDLLELEVGYGLIPLVDREQDGELLDRIQSIRKQFASQMGIIVPPIHIRDNLQLPPGGYSLLIKGVSVAEGQLVPERFLVNPGEVVGTVPGIETKANLPIACNLDH